MSRIVRGYGPSDAKIMLVGEAPAMTEVRVGKPFVGPAGQELDKLLAAAHINRDECYLTNASLQPVQGDKDKHFFAAKNQPTEAFIEGIVALAQDIQRIKPNVVVPLGNYALWAVMGHMHILKWRGSVLMSPHLGCKVVPTIHPSALLRGKSEYTGKMQGGMYKYRSVVIWDLEKVRHESKRPEVIRREREIIIDPTGSAQDEAIARLLSAESVTFDIESWGGTKLACVGFSPNDPGLAYVFSYDGSADRYSLLQRILESDNPKVGQNLMYDCTMLDQIGIHPKNIVHDTMLAQHVLCPELPRGLDFLCSVYTDIPYYKEEGKVWDQPKTPEIIHQYFNYNGKDICATAEVAQKQVKELEDENLMHIFRREMSIFEPLRWTTYYGMKTDVGLLAKLVQENDKKLEEANKKLKELAGPEFNPNSPKQMAELVYNKLRLPPRTKGGKLKTDAKTLKDIEARTGDPTIATILASRKAQKLKSNYYNFDILSSDARIRCSYRIDGTKFGRLSSAAPLWGPGLNGQNIPLSARKFIIADDGFELWELDQAQAEAVIVAYLANDPVHIDCFRHNKDVHRVTACYILGLDPADWKKVAKESSARQLAKKCNHAFNYNMQWPTFMAVVNAEHDPEDPDSPKLDPQTAKMIQEVYLQNRPALIGYWEQIRSELRLNRTLYSPLGRRHQFLDQWSDSLLKEAYSFKPQSTVGDSTNIGIVQVYESQDDDIRYLFKHGMRLWGQVHDSAIFQVPVGARPYAMKLMRTLEVPLNINGYHVIVPIEGGAGPTWNKKEHDSLGKSRISCEPEYEPAS